MILGDSRLRGNDGEKKPLICLTSFPRKRESILSYALLNKPFCSFCNRFARGIAAEILCQFLWQRLKRIAR